MASLGAVLKGRHFGPKMPSGSASRCLGFTAAHVSDGGLSKLNTQPGLWAPTSFDPTAHSFIRRTWRSVMKPPKGDYGQYWTLANGNAVVTYLERVNTLVSQPQVGQ